MTTLILALLQVVLLVSACNQDKPRHDYISNFDISPDDKSIVFSYYKNDRASLYVMDLEGRHTTKIVRSENGEMNTNPRFSPDGKKILFVKYKEFDRSKLCIAGIDGQGIQELTYGDEIITEAVFSRDGHKILYCMASAYKSNSPIGVKNAHNFDIYSIDIYSRRVEKISELDAYGLSDVSEINSSYILFYLNAGDSSGIYSFEKANSLRLKKIRPVNKTRNDNLLDHPVYFQDGVLIFTAPYELYSMSLDDRKAKLIYDSKGDSYVQIVRSFNNRPYILFKKESNDTTLISMRYDGSDIKRVEIKVEN